MDEAKKFIKLKEILPDKVVSVDIGTGMYNRVQSLLFDHMATVDAEVAIKALAEVRTREPKDKFEAHLLTLLTLVYNIEGQFHEKGFTKDVEVPIPNQKV